jgi:serine/threonine protein phosphatase PrpC
VLRRGDVLVLCSDGLSRQVRREEIASAILPVADLPAACDTLVGMANERGGPDNITVVVAMFDGEGLEPPSDGDVVERRAFDLPE